jgi:hypothetical protein
MCPDKKIMVQAVMKNVRYFLAGCVVGSATTFLLYFSTFLIAQETWYNTASSTGSGGMASVQRWKVSLNNEGTHSSVFLSSARNFVLPVVFSCRTQVSNVLLSINGTWGAQRNDWIVVVGMKGAKLTPSIADSHLLLMQECDDFDDVALSAEQLFCLLKSLHQYSKERYQWFMIVHRSTYVALNRLISTLVELDSSQVVYLGRQSSYSVPEMNKLGLLSNQQICRLDTGIVLSRAALQRITGYLQHCVGYGISRGAIGSWSLSGEVELGRCFSRRLDTTCLQSVEDERRVSTPYVRMYLQCFASWLSMCKVEMALIRISSRN